jgi:hypothetical protein
MPVFIAFKGSGAKVPYKKLLLSKPVKNANAECESLNSDGIKLYLPYKKSYTLKLLSRFMDIPEERTFKFNPLGSLVWDLCDGNNTVQDIKETVLKRSKGSEKDVERRLLKFINKLLRNELIVLNMS